MSADAVLIAQWVALALLSTGLLVLWGDLGGLAFVRRIPGGVKFLLGALLLVGMVGAIAAPQYLQKRDGASANNVVDLNWPLLSVADGREVDLQSFKGKVLFINIWATWCGPCVAELPSIEALHQKFVGRDDVVFLLISQDRSAQFAKEFAEKRSLQTPVYYPREGIPGQFRTEGIPATFIIGKDGRLETAVLGKREWSSPTWVNQLEGLAAKKISTAKNEGAGR